MATNPAAPSTGFTRMCQTGQNQLHFVTTAKSSASSAASHLQWAPSMLPLRSHSSCTKCCSCSPGAASFSQAAGDTVLRMKSDFSLRSSTLPPNEAACAAGGIARRSLGLGSLAIPSTLAAPPSLASRLLSSCGANLSSSRTAHVSSANAAIVAASAASTITRQAPPASGITSQPPLPPSPAEFEPGEQVIYRHKLPSNLNLEVIIQKPLGRRDDAGAAASEPGQSLNPTEGHPQPDKIFPAANLSPHSPPPAAAAAAAAPPPLLFVHGSYHAAWCWAQHWMPYFAARGHDCYAVSILGQGGSDSPLDAKVAGTVQSHAADLSHLIRHVIGQPPVLIGHSFGGLIVQAYLADVAESWDTLQSQDGSLPPFSPLAAAAMLCSVPPTGNMKLVMRFLRTRFVDSFKITLSLAARFCETNTTICKESFFSQDMPLEDVERYRNLINGSSKMPLFDLKKLNASLPVAPPPSFAPPVLVMGAENDFVVDREGLKETAEFFKVPAIELPNMAHDVMLDVRWEQAAEALRQWIMSK